MKLSYDEETDSLYIEFFSHGSVESRELCDDFVMDYDEHEEIVGFDIQHASRHLDLSRIQMANLPLPDCHAA